MKKKKIICLFIIIKIDTQTTFKSLEKSNSSQKLTFKNLSIKENNKKKSIFKKVRTVKEKEEPIKLSIELPDMKKRYNVNETL